MKGEGDKGAKGGTEGRGRNKGRKGGGGSTGAEKHGQHQLVKSISECEERPGRAKRGRTKEQKGPGDKEAYIRRRRLREEGSARYLKESCKGTKIGERELTSKAPGRLRGRYQETTPQGGRVSPLFQRVAQWYQDRREGTHIQSSCQVHATYRTRPSQGGSRRTGASSTDSEGQQGYHQVKKSAPMRWERSTAKANNAQLVEPGIYVQGRKGGTPGGVKEMGETDPP